MKVYESFGTFDDVKKEFNLAAKTTIVGFDAFYISEYYDISNSDRYAILAILQTKLGNDNDLENCKSNAAIIDSNILFETLNKNYIGHEDLNINEARSGELINVVVHHGIGFNPLTNEDDNLYIVNYKADTYRPLLNGSKPGVGGRGILK